MPTTIVLLNRKGGVAKTTSTLNLAAEMTAAGRTVLCCDLDPQATLTLMAGHRPHELEPEETVLAAMLPEEVAPRDGALVVDAPWGGSLMRASRDLAAAEVKLQTLPGPHDRLAAALAEHGADYDILLVDSPPSLGKLVLNALKASDYLLVPVKCDFASAGGLDVLFSTVDMVRRYERPELQILGIFGTQQRNTLHARETLEGLRKMTGPLFIPVAIPQSVAVEDAQAAQMSVGQYDPEAKPALAYRRLCAEVLRRLDAGGADAMPEAA